MLHTVAAPTDISASGRLTGGPLEWDDDSSGTTTRWDDDQVPTRSRPAELTTMSDKRVRNMSRRLVIELVVVVLLSAIPVDFPQHASSGTAWSFLLRHPSLLLHAVIGTLILLEGIAFAVRSIPAPDRLRRVLATAGAAFAGLSVVSGTAYVAGGQHEVALTVMTVGWVGAVIAYGVSWWRAHRAVATSTVAATG
jgi:FtsH-binding integral membrane protein